MSIQSVQGPRYGYYDRYSYGSRSYQPYSRYGYNVQQQQAAPEKKQKTGFWEGLKAFGKGLIKPIVNMVKHPVKTLLFGAAAAALIIATGGAATPFLIGAGLAIGGYQVAKGGYKALTADSREETLAALEDMGEGTFTLGASVIGARSYAAGTSAGSATAAAAKESTRAGKFFAYTKGLGKDCWTTLKAAPGGLKNSYAAVRSGEAMGNLKSFTGSAKLAAQRKLLGARRLYKNPDYAAAREAYISNLNKHNAAMTERADAVFNRYTEMIGRTSNDSTRAMLEARALHLADNGFVRVTHPSQIRIFSRAHLPEKALVTSLSSQMFSDPSIESYIPSEEELYAQNQYYAYS